MADSYSVNFIMMQSAELGLRLACFLAGGVVSKHLTSPWHILNIKQAQRKPGDGTLPYSKKNGILLFARMLLSTALASSFSTLTMPGVTIITTGESESQGLIGSQVQTELASTSNAPCEVLSVSHLPMEAIEERFCIFLPEVDISYLRNMGQEQYIQLQSLFRSAKVLPWITRGGGELPVKPELEMILGLSRVYDSESYTVKIIGLSVPEAARPETVAQHTIRILLDRLHDSPKSPETEYEVRNSKLCINRVVEASYLNDYVQSTLAPQRRSGVGFGNEERSLTLNVRSSGLLDTMEYVKDLEVEWPLALDEVEVKVKAVGVKRLHCFRSPPQREQSWQRMCWCCCTSWSGDESGSWESRLRVRSGHLQDLRAQQRITRLQGPRHVIIL